MKLIYESFSEIAKDFTDGGHWTHAMSKHKPEDCIPWQHGVMEFAKFLDVLGMQIVSNPCVYEELWKDVRTFKPKKYIDWCPKSQLTRRKS